MKVCIIGAGAIGGFLGTRLAAFGGAEVSVLARGPTLEALKKHGMRLNQGGELIQAPVTASDNTEDFGPQDLVIIAVKGPVLTAVANQVPPLLGPDTVVMPAMNGVPWWFGYGVEELHDTPLRCVDPGGVIANAIPYSSVVGVVIHAAASRGEPGVTEHKMGQGLIVGEPDGGKSARVQRIEGLLSKSGFDVMHSEHVRKDIWYKLWGNMTANPVSALTGATMDRLLADNLVRDFCSNAMREAATIGAYIGCSICQDPEDRHEVTAKLGAFKTSMLQDAEQGLPIELDAIVGAVREVGQILGVHTPPIDALYGITRLYGRCHGLYPE